jgi:hypothetical protein
MIQWQPIETAPEGGFVLICDANDGDYDVTVSAAWFESGKGWFVDVDSNGELLPYASNATHWMPLPEPPKVTK